MTVKVCYWFCDSKLNSVRGVCVCVCLYVRIYELVDAWAEENHGNPKLYGVPLGNAGRER